MPAMAHDGVKKDSNGSTDGANPFRKSTVRLKGMSFVTMKNMHAVREIRPSRLLVVADHVRRPCRQRPFSPRQSVHGPSFARPAVVKFIFILIFLWILIWSVRGCA